MKNKWHQQNPLTFFHNNHKLKEEFAACLNKPLGAAQKLLCMFPQNGLHHRGGNRSIQPNILQHTGLLQALCLLEAAHEMALKCSALCLGADVRGLLDHVLVEAPLHAPLRHLDLVYLGGLTNKQLQQDIYTLATVSPCIPPAWACANSPECKHESMRPAEHNKQSANVMEVFNDVPLQLQLLGAAVKPKTTAAHNMRRQSLCGARAFSNSSLMPEILAPGPYNKPVFGVQAWSKICSMVHSGTISSFHKVLSLVPPATFFASERTSLNSCNASSHLVD